MRGPSSLERFPKTCEYDGVGRNPRGRKRNSSTAPVACRIDGARLSRPGAAGASFRGNGILDPAATLPTVPDLEGFRHPMAMKRSPGHVLLAAFLGLALLAGPMEATCSDCCPQAEARTSMVAPPACCGNCPPTLERSDPASMTFSKATVALDFVTTLSPACHSGSLAEAPQPPISVPLSLRFLPPAAALPLRL